MIEQIAVLNNEAIVAKRLEYTRAGIGYIPSLDQQRAEVNEIRKTIQEGQNDLNKLLAEGYKVIAFTPFLVGHGTNFVLYKPDPEEASSLDVSEFDTPQFKTPLKGSIEVRSLDELEGDKP